VEKIGVEAMFGSSFAEFGLGVGFLVAAVLLWRYLLHAFRQQPLPFVFRAEMAGELSAVLEIALLAFGAAALIDAAVKAVS
jgi:hypothetical protein